MPDPLVSTDIAPGEYSIQGTDQLLVIEGRAYWRSPSTPAPLIKPAAPTPSAASTVGSWLVKAALAAAGIAGGYFLGPAVADRVIPPDPPPVVVPATPPARPPGTQSHSPSGPNYHPFFSDPVLPSPQLPPA